MSVAYLLSYVRFCHSSSPSSNFVEDVKVDSNCIPYLSTAEIQRSSVSFSNAVLCQILQRLHFVLSLGPLGYPHSHSVVPYYGPTIL